METQMKYVVTESCSDFSQCLALQEGPNLPKGGILTWADPNKKLPIAVFPSYKAAKAATTRTEHYRLYNFFDDYDRPVREFCILKPIREVSE